MFGAAQLLMRAVGRAVAVKQQHVPGIRIGLEAGMVILDWRAVGCDQLYTTLACSCCFIDTIEETSKSGSEAHIALEIDP